MDLEESKALIIKESKDRNHLPSQKNEESI